MQGRRDLNAIVKGQQIQNLESNFKVLIHELRSIGLDNEHL
jgi:hypothetical protein